MDSLQAQQKKIVRLRASSVPFSRSCRLKNVASIPDADTSNRQQIAERDSLPIWNSYNSCSSRWKRDIECHIRSSEGHYNAVLLPAQQENCGWKSSWFGWPALLSRSRIYDLQKRQWRHRITRKVQGAAHQCPGAASNFGIQEGRVDRCLDKHCCSRWRWYGNKCAVGPIRIQQLKEVLLGHHKRSL